MTIASLHTFVKAQSWGQKSWYICRYWGQTDMGKLNADFFQGGGFCVPRQVSQIYIYAYQTNIEKNWPGLVLNLKSKDPWFWLWATVQGHSSSLHCAHWSFHGCIVMKWIFNIFVIWWRQLPKNVKIIKVGIQIYIMHAGDRWYKIFMEHMEQKVIF